LSTAVRPSGASVELDPAGQLGANQTRIIGGVNETLGFSLAVGMRMVTDTKTPSSGHPTLMFPAAPGRAGRCRIWRASLPDTLVNLSGATMPVNVARILGDDPKTMQGSQSPPRT